MSVQTTMLPRRVNDRERDTERAGLPMLFKTTLPLRFWSKVYAAPSGCWLWQGSTNGNGYGQSSFKRRLYASHRLAYEDLVGPIPDGLVIDHLCRVRTCANPWHMEAVTLRENIQRGAYAHGNEFACLKGHPYVGPNLYRKPNGHRECRACRKEKYRAWTNDHPAKVRLYRERANAKRRAVRG